MATNGGGLAHCSVNASSTVTAYGQQ